jgi:L-xylulokinase
MKDYLVFRATGQIATDVSIQSGNGFVNLNTQAYDPQILELLGLPEIADKLAPLSYPAEVVGQVTPAAADDLGLAAGTGVVAGLFDVDATALAAGLVDGADLCLITGTAGVNVYLADRPVPGRAVAMNSLYCIPGQFLVEEGSNSSVGYIDWVAQVLYPDLWDQSAAAGTSVYPALEAAVTAVAATAGDAVFLPYLAGDEHSGDSRGVWYGLTATDRRDHLLRAAYEGIVFAHRRHVERLLAARAAPATLRLAGGGANSRFFVQLAADVFQAPLTLCDHAELGVRGVGLVAAIAAGFYPDFATAAAGLASAPRVVQPDPGLAELDERNYPRFLRAAAHVSADGAVSTAAPPPEGRQP